MTSKKFSCKFKKLFAIALIGMLLINFGVWNFGEVRGEEEQKEWSKDIRVTYNDTASSNPNIAVDSFQNVHFVWQEWYGGVGGHWEIYYKVLKDDTVILNDTRLTFSNNSWNNSWGPKIVVDLSNNINVIYVNDYKIGFKKFKLNDTNIVYINDTVYEINDTEVQDVEIALNSYNEIVVAFHGIWTIVNMPNYNIIGYIKIDNNGNFTNQKFISGGNYLYRNYLSFPSIEIDSKNNINIVWREDNNILYIKFSNNGTILVNETQITFNETADNPSIAIDNEDNIHLIYRNYNESKNIYYKKLDDNGNTIINDKKISFVSFVWEIESMNLVIDRNDFVHLVYGVAWIGYSPPPYNASIIYSKLDKNGTIIINNSKLSEIEEWSESPIITTDSKDFLYVSWTATEIYYKHTQTPSPKPDLTPSPISILYPSYNQITISSLIQNLGNKTANNFTVSLIINNQTNQTKTISLNANSSLQISFNYTITNGNYTIKIILDKENKIKELNESNNEIEKFISVFPDLTPSLFTFRDRILIGDNMTIFAIIKNIGNASAGKFFVIFLIDNITVEKFVVSLNFNENITLSFNWTAMKGEHIIKVVVDVENLILELNEGNNEVSLEIVVNEKINGNVISFYMNIFIIIGVAAFVSIVRRRFSQ